MLEPAFRRRCASVLLMLLLTSHLACFSERADPAEPPQSTLPDCPVPLSAFGSGKAVVTIYGYRFRPDTLRIRPGTIVTWVNCDRVAGVDAHTSTSDTGVWNSPFFAAGQSFDRVFDRAGTFPYHCRPHPTMRGVVIVQ